MTYQEDKKLVEETLINSKLVTEIEQIRAISHGNNNRAYSASNKNKTYFAKFYYSSKADDRNRLDNEFNFLNYAKEKNISCVPEAIFRADHLNLGIFEYIDGKKFKEGELDKINIMEGASFFNSLNSPNDLSDAKELSYASEAFLDLEEYLGAIDIKLQLLTEASLVNKDKNFSEFLNALEDLWKGIKKILLREYSFLSDNMSLCVSPSDFGFHNALVTSKGLFLLDFEYAGIDDSAKFLSDFFIQPEIQVPIGHFEEFSLMALEEFPYPDIQFERTKKLFPMFQIKWCCIILNEFLPNVAKRRLFSNPLLDIEESRKIQLLKAQNLLLNINKNVY